MARRSSFNVYI